MGIFGFSQKGTGAKSVAMSTTFCFFCDVFPVPSLRNTAPIFLEIFLIQCFTVQVKQFLTLSLSSCA